MNLNETSIRIASAIGETIGSSTLTVAAFTIATEVLFGGGLELLWAMVNTIQIAALLPLLSLNTPSFLYKFFRAINLLNFRFLDIGFIYNKYFDYTESMRKPGYDYLMLGFNTSNVFYNLTEAFLFFLTLLFFHLVLSLLVAFGAEKRQPKYRKFKNKFEFNVYFRFF